MRLIKKPCLNPKDVFQSCINSITNAADKARHESVVASIEETEPTYENLAQGGCLFLLSEHDSIDEVITKDEMVDVYETRLVNRAQGRKIYNKIRNSVKLCPFCGHGSPKTLDHYLPKAKYPLFAVTPNNLVPSCRDCNSNKPDSHADSAEKLLLHPYYDDVSAEQWLFAELQQDERTIRFFADPPSQWDQVLRSRVLEHFQKLELGEIYIPQVGAVFSAIKYQFENFKLDQPSRQQHLSELEEAFRNEHQNSWQTATYQAMADSNWYITNGFLLMSEE